MLYQRYVHKFGGTGGVVALVVPTADTSKTSAPPPSRVPPLTGAKNCNATAVPNMAAHIEATLEEYLKQGGVEHPSVITHGRDETYQSAAAKEEAAFRDFYRRQLEQKGVDAVCGPGYYRASQHGEVDVFTRTVRKDDIDAAIAAGEAAALDELPVPDISDDDDEDMCSIVSGLTTLHSALTREVLQDCERSVQTFLREEQAHVRRIMSLEEGDDPSLTSHVADDDHTAACCLCGRVAVVNVVMI